MTVLNGRLKFGNKEQIEALKDLDFNRNTESIKEFIVEKDCVGAIYCQTVYAGTEEEAIDKAIENDSWSLAMDEEDFNQDNIQQPKYAAYSAIEEAI
ncbi:MAG: hypothetical protein LBR69_03155 [Endomicrobium sp.]|jgi:hypothetical protein|nr:hypothetical protein [Endomicrobium sp.]